MGEGNRRSFSFQMKQPLAHGQDVFVAPARCTFKDLQTSRGKSQDDVSP